MKYMDILELLSSFDNVKLDNTIDSSLDVYKIMTNGEERIFAIITKESNPLLITLKCDPALAKQLRTEYETVMPAKNMNKHNWNDILCTGQLSNDELKDLIYLSYQLVIANQ